MAAVLDSVHRRPRKARFDQAAICLSAACLLHCLGAPLLLVLAPWLSLGVLGEEWFHLALVVAIIPLSLIAFRRGPGRGDRRRVLRPGLAGLGLITLAAVSEAFHIMDHTVAAVLTSVGGILLIIGHWRNLRAQACRVSRDESSPLV
ncbi:MAG: MerC domain-containing protein [Wenzhouxiangella sp.]